MSTLSPDVASAIDRVCARHGKPAAPLRAVIRKESRGRAFGTNGMPVALFEKATFYSRIDPSRRVEAVRLGLAVAIWDPHGYGDQPNTAATYALLARAAEFDRKAAYDSTSFGVGQVMGFNAALVGYVTAEAMCAAFRSVDAQVEAIYCFMDRKGVIDLLVQRKFVRAAVLLNGSKEAEHGYHQELERLYDEETDGAGVGRLALAATCPVTAAGVAVEGASGVDAVANVAPAVTDSLASLPSMPPAPAIPDPLTSMSGLYERGEFWMWRVRGILEDLGPLLVRIWAWLLAHPSVLVNVAIILVVLVTVEVFVVRRRLREHRAKLANTNTNTVMTVAVGVAA